MKYLNGRKFVGKKIRHQAIFTSRFADEFSTDKVEEEK